MKKSKVFFFSITGSLLLLFACSPSVKDAQKLGFLDVNEMKELTARGYARKEDYADAAYRDPAFCSYGAYRINGAGNNNEQKKYLIDSQVRNKWLNDQCIGLPLIWIVNNVSPAAYPIALGLIENQTTRQPDKDDAHSFVYGMRNEKKNNDGPAPNNEKSVYEYFFSVDGIVSDLQGNTIIKFPYIESGFYLIEGTASRTDYLGTPLIRFQVINESAVRRIEAADLNKLLLHLRAIASKKTKFAIEKGFPSYEFLLHATSLGLESYEEFVAASHIAQQKGFDSIWQQRRGEESGYLDGRAYKSALEKEAESALRNQQREEVEERCALLKTAMQNCSVAGDFNTCMSLQFRGWWQAQDAVCMGAY